MNNMNVFAIIVLLLAWFWGSITWAVWVFAKPTPVRYDCSVASFHPDFPAEVRKQCRKLRQPA